MPGATAIPRAFIMPYTPMPDPTFSFGSRLDIQVDMHTEQQAKPTPLTTRKKTMPAGWEERM